MCRPHLPHYQGIQIALNSQATKNSVYETLLPFSFTSEYLEWQQITEGALVQTTCCIAVYTLGHKDSKRTKIQ